MVTPLKSPQSAPTASDSAIAATISSVGVLDHPEFRNRITKPETKSRHRADRQIEPAAGDDQRLADRDGGDERAARQHVGEIVDAQEARIGERAEHADQAERQERRDRADVDRRRVAAAGASCTACVIPAHPSGFASTPVARTTMSCSVIAVAR